MDRQCNRFDMNILDCGCLHDILHFVHRLRGKDQHIFDSHMLYLENILSWLHILVYNLVDFQYRLASKNKLLGHLFHDIDYLLHKEMVDMD